MEKIELWADESDNFVTIKKPTLRFSENGTELTIRYHKENVTEKDQVLIQKNIIDEKVFGYSYILSVNPECLRIHIGILKLVAM